MNLVSKSLAAFAAVAFLSLSTAEAGPIRFRGRGAGQGSAGRFAFAGGTFGVHSRRMREGSFGVRHTAIWLDGVRQALDAAKASQALLRNGHQDRHQDTVAYLPPILRPHFATPWDEQPDEPMDEQLDRELDGQPTPEPFAGPDPDPTQPPPGGTLIDEEIDFTPNPEPATLLLFGASAAAGAAYRRRRRARG